MEPTLKSPRVSEQSRLPHSGANNSGHLMAGEANGEHQNLHVHSEALICTNSFIHAFNRYLLSTYYVGCLARQPASHSKHDRPSTTEAAGRWMGSQ